MSEWTSRIKDHRIWKILETLGPAIDKSVALPDVSPESLEALGRLKTVLTFVGRRLGGIDPLLLRSGSLDSIASAVETQKSEVDTFISDRNFEHLKSANISADTALTNLVELPGASTEEEGVALVQSMNSLRTGWEERERASTSARKQAEIQIKELFSSLETLRSHVEAERVKLLALNSDQTKSFSEAQDTRSKAFNETILKLQDNAANTATEQQKQFSSAQETRNSQFTALQAEYTKKLADQDADSTKQRETLLLSLKEQYEKEAS